MVSVVLRATAWPSRAVLSAFWTGSAAWSALRDTSPTLETISFMAMLICRILRSCRSMPSLVFLVMMVGCWATRSNFSREEEVPPMIDRIFLIAALKEVASMPTSSPMFNSISLF